MHDSQRKLRWNSSWMPGLGENRNYFTATAEEDRVDGGVAKRAPSLISYLGSVDVHAGDEVDARVEKVFQHDVAHADGGVDD